MSKKQLKIKLLPNGKIEMQTIGIKGKKCLDYVEMMKFLADMKIEKQEYTKEYYETEEQINIQQDNILRETNY
ncbi:MAG: DUF2997 domain-containing protein [Candidatus Gastranaerophilales bacterium]|nr:DUF2997 domain-containing protein [Candidatus Gastranaerophilales bacterium]